MRSSAVSSQPLVNEQKPHEQQKFRKLIVWKKAMDFVSQIYELTRQFPAEERYGLTSRLRRAALSIPLNIAEGSGASSDIEFRRFLTPASSSHYELMCGIEIASQLGYCLSAEKERILSESDEMAARLHGLKRRLAHRS